MRTKRTKIQSNRLLLQSKESIIIINRAHGGGSFKYE